MDLSNENIIHIKKDNVEYIQFRKLLEYKNITHCYTLKSDGKLNFRSENNATMLKSYENISRELGFTNIIKPKQTHSDNITIIENNERNLNEIDGLITNEKNVTLGTTSADCISLLFYDPNKNVIANVHSGWRGTEKGIAKKTVQELIEKFNCQPKDIICCICPSIRKCHFEVENDVKEIFEKEFKDLKIEQNNDIMEKQKDKEKWNIDTVLINKILLKQEGLKQENIIDSGICSVCNSDLIHSYRVEKQGYGLATALIKINDKGL